MTTEHPFAEYIRILGRGKNGSRALTHDEARQAMSMILADAVEPVQLGAFLMLMRVKEETPEEVAGFVRAARDTLSVDVAVRPDLDWSSYAGKRRQLPWFLLAALLLSQRGVKVFMHGATGPSVQRVYTPAALTALGITPCASLHEATEALRTSSFAYAPLAAFLPRLQALIDLRQQLGLRSPVHTVARLLNPLGAQHVLQGIFHPGYKLTHQQAAGLLTTPHCAVLKGDGGEIERNPDAGSEVLTVHDGVYGSEAWPALFTQRHLKDETMDAQRLAQVWRGTARDDYGEAAAVGTLAIALKLLARADTVVAAEILAREWWEGRTRDAM